MTVVLSRLDQARQAQAAGGVTTLSQALTPRPAKVDTAAAWANYQAQAHEAAAAKKAAEPTGWKGFLADVLGNSVVKTVLKPLSVLDIPRRVVISAVKETGDLILGDALGVTKGHASFGDFATQVKDESFGFGRFIHTGNTWVDRAIGLAGDVALDPLTYVGMHGAGKFAGAEGRGALAMKMLESTTANMTVEEVAAIGKRAARAAREGRAALDATDIARLGLDRSGFHMFGHRINAVHIPGTGPLADATEAGIARIRLAISDSAVGDAFRRAFTPNDFRDVRLSIARGGDLGVVGNASLSLINARNIARATEAEAIGVGEQAIKGAIDTLGTSATESFRNTAHAVMEGVAYGGRVAASPAEQAFVDHWIGVFKKWGSDVTAAMQKADPTSGFGTVENYFPHMLTEDAIKYMRDLKNPNAGELRAIFDKPLTPESVFQNRTLKEGVSGFFGHGALKREELNIGTLNDIANRAGFKGNFFETDIVKVAEQYVGNYSHQMGTAARLTEVLKTGGVAEAIAYKNSVSVVTDPAAIDAIKTRIKALEKAESKILADVRLKLKAAVDTAVGAQRDSAQVLSDLAQSAQHAAAREATAAASLATSRGHLDDAMRMLADYKTQLVDLHSGVLSIPASAMSDELTRLQAELAQVDAHLVAAHAANKASTGDVKVATKALDDAQKAAEKAVAKIEDAMVRQHDALTYNQLIGQNVNDGVRPMTHDEQANAARVQTALSGGGDKRNARAQSFRTIAPGSEIQVEQIARENGFFKMVASQRPISAKAVGQQSERTFDVAIAANVAEAGGEHLDAARVAAVGKLIRDARVAWPNGMPPIVQTVHDNLLAALKVSDSAISEEARAAATDLWAKVQARGERASARGASDLTKSVGHNWSDMQNMAEEIQQVADQAAPFVALKKALGGDPLAAVDPAVVNAFLPENMAMIVLDHSATAGEALDAIDGVLKGYMGQTWKVSGTRGEATKEFTIADALPTLTSDGKTALGLYMEKKAADHATALLTMQGLPAKDAASALVTAMVEYKIVVETSQRFSVAAGALASGGASVADAQLLHTVVGHVVGELRPHWAGLAAKGDENAIAMIGKLDSLAAAPTPEMFAHLTADHAAQMRAAAAGRTATNTTIGLSGEAQTKSESALTKIKSLTENPQDPTTHVAATMTHDMSNALHDLAGMNLDAATLADGATKGFEVNGKIVTMRDGSPLIFTPAEANAIYAGPNMVFKDAAGMPYGPQELPARLEAANAEVSKWAAGLQHAKAQADRLSPASLRRDGITATAATEKDFATWSGRVEQAKAAVQQAQEGRTLLQEQIATMDPATRAAAMDKVKVLVDGNGTDGPWYRQGMTHDALAVEDPTLVQARRQATQERFAASPAAAHLSEVSAVADSNAAVRMNDFLGNPDAVAQHVAAATEVAKAADPRIGTIANVPTPAEHVAKIVDAAAQLETAKAGHAAAFADVAATKTVHGRLTAEVKSLEKAMAGGTDAAAVKAEKVITAGITKGEKAVAKVEPTVVKAQSAYDAVAAVSTSAQTMLSQQLPGLQADIARAEAMMGTIVTDLADATRRAAGGKPAEIADALHGARSLWLEDAKKIAANLDPTDPMAVTTFQAVKAEGEWLLNNHALAAARGELTAAEAGVAVGEWVKAIPDGFASMEKLGLPGMMADERVVALLSSSRRAAQPAVAKELSHFMGRYTKFFKAYATLSPGFHVRNAMSNTFSLFSAGAETRHLAEGLGLYGSLIRHTRAGGSVEEWIAKLVTTHGAETAAHADIAVRSMEAAGMGAVEEALVGYMRKGHTLSDNALTRGSKAFGHKVESSARFMLGYDSAKVGMDFRQAAARVKRHLFDYTDVGMADEAMRQFIPFWMWMSRNLPLTLVNQWANPKAYAIYNSIVRNVGSPAGPNEVVPSYITEQGGFRIAKDWYITPDFGFNRVQQQLTEFGDFSRLASYINPGLRVPFELMGSRKLYNGATFSDKPQKAVGGAPVEWLAKLLGQSKTAGDGSTVVSDRFNYALMNLLPPLAQAERVFSPNTASYQDRQGNSIAGYLGVPVKHVTAQMQASELKSRQFQTAAEKAKAKALANYKG